MAKFTDTFDGPAGQLVSARPGWTPSSGYYDVLKIDGNGAIGFDVFDGDGKGVLHDTGSASHYLKVVVGAGFIASDQYVTLGVHATGRWEYVNLGYNSVDNRLHLRSNGSGLWTGQYPLSPGDSLELRYIAGTHSVLVLHNDVLLHLEALGGAATWLGNLCTISLAYDPPASALTDVLRSVESGPLIAATMTPYASDSFDQLTSGLPLTGTVLDNALGGSAVASWTSNASTFSVNGAGKLGFADSGSEAIVNLPGLSGNKRARVKFNSSGDTANNIELFGNSTNSLSDRLLVLLVEYSSLRVCSVTTGDRTDHTNIGIATPSGDFWLELEIQENTKTVIARVLNLDESIWAETSHTFGALPSLGTYWGFKGFFGNNEGVFDDFVVESSEVEDAEPPVLSDLTVVEVHPTYAVVNIVTDTVGGDLYFLTSISSSADVDQVLAGSSRPVTAAGLNVLGLYNLGPESTYYVHCVHVKDGNNSNLISSTAFTTPAVGDIPTVDYWSAYPVSSTSIGAWATPKEATGGMFMVVTTSNVSPSAAQVMAGQDALGNPAVYADDVDVSSLDNSTFVASGLSPLTPYYVYFVHRNDSDQASLVCDYATETYRAGATGQQILDTTGPAEGRPAGILFNDVDPGDEDKWFSFTVVTPPTSGTLDINPDGSFTFVGQYATTFQYQLEEDGVAVGDPATVYLYATGPVDPGEPDTGVMKLWNGTTWLYGVLKKSNGSVWVVQTPP